MQCPLFQVDKRLLMAKSPSSVKQKVEELVNSFKNTSVTLKSNGSDHREFSGDIIDAIISTEKSVRKSKRILKRSKDKEEMELFKEYKGINANVKKYQSQEEEIIKDNEDDREGSSEKTTCTKSYVEEDLLQIVPHVIIVDPVRDEEDLSKSVDESNEINMCKSFKPNKMPRVVIKVVPEIEKLAARASKKRKGQLNNDTDKVDKPNRSKIRNSSRLLKNNKIILEHEKENKSNASPKRSKNKSTGEKPQNHHSKYKETEKSFPCKNCDKSFQFASALKLHTVSHTGEKPYACNRCSISFTQKSHLKRHSLTHKKNAKKFKCSDCNMSFRLNFSLQVHKRVHSGAKPYTCKECSKSFSQKSHLNTHSKSHEERKFICDLCNKHFTLLHHLSHHLQHFHNSC